MSTKAHRSRNAAQRRDHYAEVTERVITALEAGIPPWRQPWDPDKADTPTMPRNAVTGARYRGINILTLGMSALAFGGGDPRWATYKQAAELGWQVRKGECGTTAFFFKPMEVRDTKARPDDEETTKRIPLLRAFTLFHASQIDGMPVFVPSTVEARRGAPPMRSRRSSPTAASWCGSAANAPSILPTATRSRCRGETRFIPPMAGAARSCTRPHTLQERRIA
jgi:antirestriction protein ArdC